MALLLEALHIRNKVLGMVVGDSMGFMSIEINESFVVLNDCCKVSGCFNVGHVIRLVGADPSDVVVSSSCERHAGPSANTVSGGAGDSADDVADGYGGYYVSSD